MKGMAAFALAGFLLIAPSLARAAEFSLYGVGMGMPRAELEKVWKKMENGDYSIPGTSILNIKTEFDYKDRLYVLNFSVPIGEQYPAGLMATAFQRIIDEMWRGDPTITLSTRASRGVVDVSVTSRRLQEEYIGHIKMVLSPLLKP